MLSVCSSGSAVPVVRLTGAELMGKRPDMMLDQKGLSASILASRL